MRPLTKGAWRSVRILLLVVCAGGILAADNTWVSSINLDFVKATHWFSGTSATAEADLPTALSLPVDITPRARLSMDGLLNGLLFERPTGRWALAARSSDAPAVLPMRVGELEQINPNFYGNNYFAYHRPARFAPVAATTTTVIAVAELSPTGPSAVTASGNWISNASGNWSTAANWQGGVIADGAGNSANFNALNLTTDVTVTLDTSRTIGTVLIGDTDGTHRYTIAGAGVTALTFDSGAPFTSSELQQSSTSAGDTIAAPIFLATGLNVTNLSTTNPFTISGNISSNATGFLFLSIAGNVNVSGNISSGSANLNVGIDDGVTIFTGTNTYKGSTSVGSNGTLLVNGNNSGATGSTFVSGGILGGTGTIGSGNVQTFDGTITGATTTTVGTLTLLGSVDLSTGEGDGTYLANLSGSLSDLLAITGTLSLGQGSILDIDGVGDGVTTYTLATFASRDDVFGTVMGVPGGYTLVYHDTDIQLVPTAIPEPATWVGGALALGAIVFIRRRRARGN